METFGNQKVPKSSAKYFCEKCNYTTSRVSQYTRHISTQKHQRKRLETILCNNSSKSSKYACIICNKIFQTNSGLWKHKKSCKFIKEETDGTDNIDYKKMLLEFIKDNNELQKTLVEILPKMGNTVNNTINNNNNININLFLNEQCKNAMTMNEFINQLSVSLDDLAITKEKGIYQGIINILTKNLKELSIYERPMHCTDVKRETVYIKSSGNIIGGKEEPAIWTKDDKNRLLKQAIDKASHVQRLNLKLWTNTHPNWETDSDEQIEYMTLVRNSMEDIKEKKNEDKVIKKLCEITHLDGKG
jgi:hypothetical protein